ncbi:hypothetical protein FS837_009894 [Tulasnella sp. UAMH 9824]|nr:hypothetical protein FS837_009894 [Tulasnella sp. UAMH 9824]
MAPRSSFKQVYVDIPPSPYTSARKGAREQQQAQQVEQAPKPRFRPVPVVEIPRSPLWKHTPQRSSVQEGSQLQKPIASLKMNSDNPRPAPLKEKNVQHSNAAQHVDRKSGKRKAGDLDAANEAKKPRLDPAAEPQQPQRKPTRQRRTPQPTATVTGLPGQTGLAQATAKKRGRPTKAEQAARASAQPNDIAPVPKPVIRRPRKVPAPPMPELKPLPYAITKQEAEDRTMTHRDALDDFSRPLEFNPVKNMFSSLLDILTEDATENDLQESLKEFRVEVRRCTDVGELGSVITELTQSLSLAPPVINPQGTKQRKKAAAVDSTTQLIPSILSLIELALQGPSIRDDVAEGVEESKRIRTTMEEKIKLEKTIWANVKKTWTERRDAALEDEQKAKEKLKEGETLPASETFDLKQWKEDFRAIEAKHQTKIRRLQLALMQQLSMNLLRFTPAGTGLDGRTYWILSLPAEGAKTPSAEDREEFRRWAWFLAVWVPSPSAPSATSRATSSTLVSDDVSGSWHALGEAQEIRALIKWSEWKALEKEREEVSEALAMGAEGSSSEVTSANPSESASKKALKQPWRADLKTLCKRLEDFADFLEWKLGA